MTIDVVVFFMTIDVVAVPTDTIDVVVAPTDNGKNSPTWHMG